MLWEVPQGSLFLKVHIALTTAIHRRWSSSYALATCSHFSGLSSVLAAPHRPPGKGCYLAREQTIPAKHIAQHRNAGQSPVSPCHAAMRSRQAYLQSGTVQVVPWQRTAAACHTHQHRPQSQMSKCGERGLRIMPRSSPNHSTPEYLRCRSCSGMSP